MVMLAHKYRGTKDISNWNFVYAQPKIDGMRATLYEKALYSRNGNRIVSLPELTDEVAAVANAIGGARLDGELVGEGMSFEDTMSVVRRNTPLPRRKDIVFKVFDIDGDGTFEERLKIIQSINSLELRRYTHVVGTTKIMTDDKVKFEETLMFLYNMYIDEGYEGLMLRNPASEYKHTRSRDLLKLKPEESGIFRISGFIEQETITGFKKDTLGSLIITDTSQDVKCVIGYVGSGITNDLRDQIWRNKEHFLNKPIKVKYTQRTEAGALRFPRFAGFASESNIVQ